jgi:hypothetical protein
MLLSREDLIKTIAATQETVTIGGGEVIVREIGAIELMGLYLRPDIRQEAGEISMLTFTPALIALAVIDENGNRIFSDSDVGILEKASPGKFKILADAARKLNGFGDDEEKN